MLVVNINEVDEDNNLLAEFYHFTMGGTEEPSVKAVTQGLLLTEHSVKCEFATRMGVNSTEETMELACGTQVKYNEDAGRVIILEC